MAAMKHEYEFMERFHVWVTGQIINQVLLTRKHVILVISVVFVAS